MARGFVYLAAVVDWFSRRVLAWRVSISMDVSFCIEAVEEALGKYGAPEIFNSDQGRWGGCRPPQTASQCAKLVVLVPLSGKDGNRDKGYDDWRRPSKVCFSPARRIDGGAAEVSKETVAAGFR